MQMKGIPPDYNDGDLLDERSHREPCFVRRTTHQIGILLFVIIALMLLLDFVASR
jgi:hypothetical protein